MAGKKDVVKDSERFSIIQERPVCFICGSSEVQMHEIFYGTANRAKSKKFGMCCYLCYSHHHGSNSGVHYNPELDTKLKQHAEKIWIKTYAGDVSLDEGIEKFIDEFGRNYLE